MMVIGRPVTWAAGEEEGNCYQKKRADGCAQHLVGSDDTFHCFLMLGGPISEPHPPRRIAADRAAIRSRQPSRGHNHALLAWHDTGRLRPVERGPAPSFSSGSSLCRALLLGFKHCSAGTWLHASALNRNAVTPRPGIASAGHWVRCTSPRQSITQPACLDELLAAKVGRAECAIGTGTEMLVRFASVPASAQVRHSHRIVGFGVCHLFSVRPGGGVWGRGVSAGRRQPTTQRSRCVTDG